MIVEMNIGLNAICSICLKKEFYFKFQFSTIKPPLLSLKALQSRRLPDWVGGREDEEAGGPPLLQDNSTLLPLRHRGASRLPPPPRTSPRTSPQHQSQDQSAPQIEEQGTQVGGGSPPSPPPPSPIPLSSQQSLSPLFLPLPTQLVLTLGCSVIPLRAWHLGAVHLKHKDQRSKLN